MKLNLSENKINEIIDNSINKILKEYHVDQRLPFDDDFYGKKNQLEQYVDWLEDFGKYGELPPSSLNFKEEVEKTMEEYYKTNNWFKRSKDSRNKILKRYSRFFKTMIYPFIDIDDKGNLYIEREIMLSHKPNETNNNLYDDLKNKFQNNVGGCWSLKRGGSNAYCGEGFGKLKLVGRIRIEDIDFLNTIYVNCLYGGNEYEIRVRPNAVVAIESVDYNGYKHVFNPTLLSKASFFGSKGRYFGNFAPVKDTYKGTNRYIDRENNINDSEGLESINKYFETLISNGSKPEDVFEIFEPVKFGIFKIRIFSLGYNYYDTKKNKIICKKWFKSYDDINKIWNKIIYSYLRINAR